MREEILRMTVFAETMKETETAIRQPEKNMEPDPENYWHSFDREMKKRYGGKVYRLSLSAGCSCPNRDGTKGTGGCAFCSEGGSGEFAQSAELSVKEQIFRAKELVKNKLSRNFKGYIAYFQPFSNTYSDAERLRKLFMEAVNEEDILAVDIATRPDCLPPQMIQMLSEINRIKPVWVELGLQTIHDKTGEKLNRCFDLKDFEAAEKALKENGIELIVHLILGLPGETEEMMEETVRYIAGSGADGVKLSQLYVLENTAIAERLEDIVKYTPEEYTNLLVRFVRLLPERMVIHRLTGDPPKKGLIYPKWAGDKKRILNLIRRTFRETGSRQGDLFCDIKKPGYKDIEIKR